MFLVNSRLHLFTAAPSRSGREGLHNNGALLIPKLRSEFAEFLNEGSLERLRILSSPTCVGLRYGHLASSLQELFLGAWHQRPNHPMGWSSRLGIDTVFANAFLHAATGTTIDRLAVSLLRPSASSNLYQVADEY